MLSLNQSIMQLSMAAGAGFGGIIVNKKERQLASSKIRYADKLYI